MQCKVLLSLYLLTLIKSIAPAMVWTRLNSSARLPCTSSPPPPPLDLGILEVSWTYNGSVRASYSPTENRTVDGFSWDTSLFPGGDFSLTVNSAVLSQQGAYECQVKYNRSQLHSSNVTLGVEVAPSLSLVSSVVVLDMESELQCRAEGFNPPLINFTWTREGEVIRASQPVVAVEVAPDGLYRVTAGLGVSPGKDDQNMTFGCEVAHPALDQPLATYFQLSFVFLPTVRLLSVPSASRDKPLTLACDVQGFYPDEVSVSWLQNGSALPDPLPSEPNPDGTYATRRFYSLSPEQREQAGEVECVVSQPGISHLSSASADLEEIDPVEKEPVLTKSAKASVALMCISLVLVFLLCFGFSWRRRDEKQKSLMVSGIILPPRVTVGQKGRVSLSVEGRRVDRVQTSWFLNDTPISDTSLTVSEKGPLLASSGEHGYYKLHSQRPLHSSKGSSQQLISSLSFIPKISIHKGAVFKCQVSYIGKDKVVVEKVSEKFTILAAPEVSEIQLTESNDDSGVVTLTVQASHFHPDIITFRWFCQGGELSPVASQPSTAPRPDAQGFFSARSQCRLPRPELERGCTKVWVSVHHIALRQPVTRETRGFIKRPRVSEISSSAPSPDRPLTLGCDITGFYPPDLSVTWLRLRKGPEDDGEEEVLEGGEVWGPVLTQPAVYRAHATLSREGGREERTGGGGGGGRGVICRVEHCSLEEPIERCWRNIHIAAPSIPPSLSVGWTGEGVGVFSLVLRGGRPRPRLLWVAGGASLAPLRSSDTEGPGGDGGAELKSVCALEKTSGPQRKARKTKMAVTDPDSEGIEFIDEQDGDNNNMEREKESRTEEEEEEEEEEEGMIGELHINRVSLRRGPRGEETEQLRVSVEITHPAFPLPVHRTWTGPKEEVPSSR